MITTIYSRNLESNGRNEMQKEKEMGLCSFSTRCEFEIETIISVDETLLFYEDDKRRLIIMFCFDWRKGTKKIGEEKNEKMKVVEKRRCALL